MKSAESDFSQEKLKDIMYTFYSVEEIMAAKAKVYDLLGKPFDKRKNPNKKCKELEDLIEAFLVCKDKFNRVKYFADSYRKLPPVSLEFIAPLIANLANEITKINEVLPKILDVKTEVSNSADTIREMRIDLNRLVTNSHRVKSMSTSPSTSAQNCANIEKTLKSIRQEAIHELSALSVHDASNKEKNETKSEVSSNTQAMNMEGSPSARNMSSNRMLSVHHSQLLQPPQLFSDPAPSRGSEPGKSISQGASPPVKDSTYADITKSIPQNDRQNPHGSPRGFNSQPSSSSSTYQRNNENKEINNNKRKDEKMDRNKKRLGTRSPVTGDRALPEEKFKAADRQLDLFVGNVSKDVKILEITNYIYTK